MSALSKQPIDYVNPAPGFEWRLGRLQGNVTPMHHAPRHVTAKGETDYLDYMAKKVQAKNERIEYLEEQNGFLKNDLITAALAAVLLLITNGIVLYQWLVVCGGQAPG